MYLWPAGTSQGTNGWVKWALCPMPCGGFASYRLCCGQIKGPSCHGTAGGAHVVFYASWTLLRNRPHRARDTTIGGWNGFLESRIATSGPRLRATSTQLSPDPEDRVARVHTAMVRRSIANRSLLSDGIGDLIQEVNRSAR